MTPKFVVSTSPELQSYIFTASPSWADIVEASNRLRQQLGISRSAWIEACQTMGRYQAATAVAVIAAKGKIIRSPGGYLRGMIGRANGELHRATASGAWLGASVHQELTMRRRCSASLTLCRALCRAY